MPVEIFDDRRPGEQKESRGSYSCSCEGKMERRRGARWWLALGVVEQGAHALQAKVGAESGQRWHQRAWAEPATREGHAVLSPCRLRLSRR
jgi:hypothetical protein